MRRAIDPSVLEAIIARVGDESICAAVEAVYAELAEVIAANSPVCDLSGRCCRFREFDHELWVTSPEVVHFLTRLRQGAARVQPAAREAIATLPIGGQPADACPFQLDGLCSVHEVRPLGCRLFFCQSGAEIWGHPTHEKLLNELRSICKTHSLPYAYAEWTAMVSAVGPDYLNPSCVSS